MEAPRHAWDYWHLRIQLAAEVEKVNKLREQLAAERERVQTIVDALTDTKSALNNGGYFTPIIDAALAKVKEGK